MSRRAFRRFLTARRPTVAVRVPASSSAQRALLSAANVTTGGLLGVETKFYDTWASGFVSESVDMTGMMLDPAQGCLSAPSEGDAANQRSNTRIRIRSVQIKGHIYTINSSNMVQPAFQNRAMVALVWDKQTNGAACSSSAIFTNPSAGNPIAAQPLRNMEYSSRFTVLKTWEMDLTPQTLAYEGPNSYAWNSVSCAFECFLPLSLDVNFLGTVEGVASVVDNSLHVVANTSGTTTSTACYYLSRIRYE